MNSKCEGLIYEAIFGTNGCSCQRKAYYLGYYTRSEATCASLNAAFSSSHISDYKPGVSPSIQCFSQISDHFQPLERLTAEDVARRAIMLGDFKRSVARQDGLGCPCFSSDRLLLQGEQQYAADRKQVLCSSLCSCCSFGIIL